MLLFGIVWLVFGIFGLFESPEKKLLIASHFIASAIHLAYFVILLLKRPKE